ncbi:hypothetical protein GW17_00029943 [Ensete ventricosum]|nr:hypothetical protein GW17_00029943 [Ensete ventricosum]
MFTASPLAGAIDCSQGPLAGGRPAMARPHARCGRLQPRPPCKGAADCDQGQPARGQRPPVVRPQGHPPGGGRLLRDACKGRQPLAAMPQGLLPTVCRRPHAANPQGATDYGFDARRKVAYGQRHRQQGLPPRRVAASSGSAYRGGACGGAGRSGGRPLAEWLSTGKGSRCLRRGNTGGGGAVRVKEG